MTEYIRIVYTEEDVLFLAAQAREDGIEVTDEQALERAENWGRYITSTASEMCSEQLSSVIASDTP